MKFHILTEIKESAWGGGNQFQKALREYLREQNLYTDEIMLADAVLANSHHWADRLWEVFKLKRQNPRIIIIHRVDGPVSIVRNNPKQRVIDKNIMNFNKRFADGTIYQSEWSRTQSFEQGIGTDKPQIVIHNAPDQNIFYPPKERKKSTKFRLIATSWSTNVQKGFDIYKYLDENLDFMTYSFTFIGNTPLAFRNIEHKPTMSSEELAEELRNHDLIVHASLMESCSNALIEAMNCGLVPVARNNTSHPEIIKRGGLLFDGEEDVLSKIEHACKLLDTFRRSLRPPKINEIGSAYVLFVKEICDKQGNTFSKPGWIDLFSVWVGFQITRVKLYWDHLFFVK